MITAIVLAKNEEKNIIDCVESLSWCNEILIVDDNSTDRTQEIVESFENRKIKLIQQSLNGDFSKQRNLAMSRARNEWVLFIDADERVDESLKREIEEKAENDLVDGYLIQRIDNMWGKEFRSGEAGNIKLVRLAKKSKGKWEGKVHEKWMINGKIGELNSPLFHFPHQKLSDFLREINDYTTLRAEELKEKGVRVKTRDIAFYPAGKFINNYFLKLGIRDGIEGFIFAIVMSFHSFLVRAKLWLLWN